MNAGKFESIGRGQFIREGRDKGAKPFAVRLFIPSATRIEAGKEVRPLAELGAIAYNFEWFNGREVLQFDLEKPQTIHGIEATVRAEVWKSLEGVRKRLTEEWYATRTPKGCESFAHFVNAYVEAEQTEKENELVAKMASIAPNQVSTKPVRRGEDEKPVDHRANAKEVTLQLMKREYPNFFKAREAHLSDEEQRKAYIADLRAIHGISPEVEDCASLWSDTGFARWLNRAMTAPGRKVTPAEWALATGWIPRGYYRMTDSELEKALNDRTGSNLKGDSWRRKAQRMGLVNARKIGRPENPSQLPSRRVIRTG